MEVRYICPLITVKDIEKSRKFYVEVLNQEVEIDHGANLAFKGGFAIHDIDHYQGLLGDSAPVKTDVEKNFMELYFESEDLKGVQEKLESIGSKFIHGIREQPWGQRVMRFYDPDGYIIEVGEPLEFVIRRFATQCLSTEEISEKSSMPIEFVKKVLEENILE
ncbi:VOC family protein [Methanobacterium petrolearium]|uniref:VOC family protein n=1 Tax=Methanobacterium petrolearium TaxID=710190 RepID=UPI001AEA3849|nr:VOC family protein [Methanobacterium petrolearium]MBP1945608.1 putative enzyme related to lactoylglutathione lyase [Methanobacterium petrolearium]BDZ71839.1 glyoxalase/bleomycin resistance/dioxygenase family protein [Methanobacterium petrolearium]